MTREDMLAKLIAQATAAGGDLVTLRAIVEESSELGADRVLVRLGLGDARAPDDLDELRELLGAWRAGIRTVLIPKENEADLDDLPREVLDQMEVHAVGSIDQALSIALRGASWSEGKLLFPELPLPPMQGSRGAEGEARLHGGR